MLYLFESNISENKPLSFALTNVYGIGKANSVLICKQLGCSLNVKVKDLPIDHIQKIVKIIELLNLRLSTDLKKYKALILKTLVSIKSYRGLRRIQGLPIRGQRTHSNAKTSRKIK